MKQLPINDRPRVKSLYQFTLFFPVLAVAVLVLINACGQAHSEIKKSSHGGGPDSPSGVITGRDSSGIPGTVTLPKLDTAEYRARLIALTNKDSSGKWPVKTAFPLDGAILPFNRIVAFYGNLYSKKMGILGELPKKDMLDKLKMEVAAWQKADSSTHVIPALHYIAVTAQGSPGKGNKYRLRMPLKQIDSVISIAREINALVFIDIQVGHSTLQEEIPQFEKYLKMPNVHLGIDPEFSMKGGQKPGTVIGTFDAADINYASGYLANLVKQNNLAPKILIVHRFTQGMVTNYRQIRIQPEVQVIMNMDGWGHQARKISTYKLYIHKEPVEFTGFKLFYKNDLREAKSHVMSPGEVLNLKPRPIYIQYQ
jgi:hypothetical protein